MDKVLALKYRPKSFDELIGQETISQTLSLALDSDRIAHAYLLSGLRGSGKTSTARILSKSILCEKGPSSKPCELCDSCISANSGKHMDIVEMDAASNRGIDDIKKLIEHIRYKPSVGKYKIFIIDEIHMLTNEAFNALLKTLEEPPAYVRFVLATTDPLKLPATILSRTQHFRFKKISVDDVVQHLSYILNIEKIEFEKQALEILARHGHGSLRDSLTILDQAIIYTKSDITVQAVTQMLGLVDDELFDKLFDIVLNQKDIDEIVEELKMHEFGMVLDELSIYLKNCLKNKNPKFDMMLYERCFKIIANSKYLLSLNSDEEFVLYLTLMKLKEASKKETIDNIINKIQSIPTTDSKKTLTKEQPIEEKDDKELFKMVIENIYDKSFEVGQCIENGFKFIRYADGLVYIKSKVDEKCKTLIWQNYDIVKTKFKEVFKDMKDIKYIKDEEIKTTQEPQLSKEDTTEGSSCIENSISKTKAVDGMPNTEVQDIQNSDMVKKTQDYFKTTDIKIQTKA